MQDDWNAKQYEKSAILQEHTSTQVLKSYEFAKDAQILDVGCGDGHWSNRFAILVPQGQVIAIDSSLNMIQYAKEKYANTANLQFKLLDATQIDFEHQFTDIVSLFCLHWITDHESLLLKFNKALKKGGRILFLLPSHAGFIDDIIQVIMQSKKWHSYFEDSQPVIKFFSDEEYQWLLHHAGFVIDSLTTKGYSCILPNSNTFKEFISALPFFKQWVLAEKLDELYQDVVIEFENYFTPDAEGKYHVQHTVQVVKAHK